MNEIGQWVVALVVIGLLFNIERTLGNISWTLSQRLPPDPDDIDLEPDE